jgi:hypothetical protein
MSKARARLFEKGSPIEKGLFEDLRSALDVVQLVGAPEVFAAATGVPLRLRQRSGPRDVLWSTTIRPVTRQGM